MWHGNLEEEPALCTCWFFCDCGIPFFQFSSSHPTSLRSSSSTAEWHDCKELEHGSCHSLTGANLQLLGSPEEANAKKYEGVASSEMSNSAHVGATVFGTPNLAGDDIPL